MRRTRCTGEPRRADAELSRRDQIIVPLDFFVVSGWRRDDATPPLKFPIRITLSGPGGKLLLSEQEMKLDPNHLGTVAARVQGLPIQGPGQYRIGVEWHDPHALAWKEGPWAGLWIPPLEQPAPANPETNG